VLLYWPVYDLWMGEGNRELRFTVHHPGWIEDTDCGEAGRWMINNGYTFDFISDEHLRQTIYKNSTLVTAGKTSYRTILLSGGKYIKTNTFRHLVECAKNGATILVWRLLPEDVPGWFEHISRKNELMNLINELSFDSNGLSIIGRGKVVINDDLGILLAIAGIEREQMVDAGLSFIRRKHKEYVTYFIADQSIRNVVSGLL
jgi:hypothetical protein